MFITNNKDTSSATARQPEQKAAKEKTMATAPVTSVAQIDVTKPLTQEEMALVNRSREQDAAQQVNGDTNNIQTTAPPTTVTNDTSNLEAYAAYRNELIASEKEGGIIDAEAKVAEKINPETNPILPTTKKEEIEPEKVVEKAPEISSTVGDFATTKDKQANLGVDVALVQGHLLRLGMLSKEDFDAEKITTTEAIEKTTIPKTIAALRNFQIDVLGYGGDGYASPGGGTIMSLINLTPEQLQVEKIKVAEAKSLAEAEVKAKEEAKQKAIKDEQDRKLQEEVKIRLSAQRVHDGIYGAGTNEQKVYLALARLNNDDKQIARFKKVYAELYNADVIADIEGDFSFSEEDKALAYLNIGGVEKKEAKKDLSIGNPEKQTDLNLVETGEKLLENQYYHKGYAYIPFTDLASGNKYDKGDAISAEDRKNTYGTEDKPTWCNMFARDLIKEIKGSDPFEGDKSAKDIYNFMLNNPDIFVPVDSGFEDAWINLINKNEIVLLADNGHIAIGVPTELTENHMRTYINTEGKEVKEKIGDVIQAGKSHGHFILSKAWAKKDFRNIKLFKYVPKD